MSLEQLIKEAKELCDSAHPAPWDARVGEHLDSSALPRHIWSEYGWIARCQMGKEHCVPNAAFIAASRSLVPLLLKIVERQRDALVNVLNQPFSGDWDSQAIYVQKKLRECDELAREWKR